MTPPIVEEVSDTSQTSLPRLRPTDWTGLSTPDQDFITDKFVDALIQDNQELFDKLAS